MRASLVKFLAAFCCWMGVVFAVQAIPADREASDSVDVADVEDASSAGVQESPAVDDVGDPTATPMPEYKRDYFSGEYDIWGNEVWMRYDEHVTENGGIEWYFVADAFKLVRPDSQGRATDESIWMNVDEFMEKMGARR